MKKKLGAVLLVVALVLSFGLVPTAAVGANPDPGIVGLWHFDGNANDSSGNGNDGTVYGGAGYVSGKFGQALSFDGTDDYVDCGAAVDNGITTGITLEAWIKPAVKQRGGIISNDVTYYSPHKGYDFFLWDDATFGAYGSLFIDFGNGTSLGRTFWSIPSLDWYGHWHHVAATWDGSDISLYVDGSQVSALTYSGNYSDPDKSTFIGAINLGSPIWRFDGEIDEVRIWDQALTADQVKASSDLRNGTQIEEENLDEDGYPDVIFTSAFYELSSGDNITLTMLPVDSSANITGVTKHRVTPNRTYGNIVVGSVSASGYSVDVTVYNMDPEEDLPPCKTIHLWLWLSTGDHVGVNAQFRR